MIGRVFVLLAVLCTSVRSLPVTSGHLESEDVKVLKCIVEALADVLSKPRPLPVSQDCLHTLTTDDRLVAILRHQNFLKDLQEIALEGSQKRAPEDAPLQPTRTADDNPDRSMLESLGGPGERSILSQEESVAAGERGERRGGHREVQDKRDEPQEERAERTRGEEGEKRGRTEKKGSEHSEKRDSTKTKTTSEKEDEREESSSLHSLKPGEKRGDEKRGDEKRGDEKRGDEKRGDEKGGDEKRGDEKRGDEKGGDEKRGDEKREREDKRGEEKRSGLKLWSKRAKSAQKNAAVEEETAKRASEEDIPHHSKEMTNQEVETAERRSPEDEELQLIARTATEEDEGSGNKKEAEIESLATIESELESVAQKLHALSRADRGQRRA